MRRLRLAFLLLSKGIGLFRVARWLTREQLKILCYHGFELVDEAAFRPKLFMKPERFACRLETIRRWGLHVLPLDEAVERLYARTLPKNAVVITVDDGFQSFQRLAVPHLLRYAFPATVYVTSYYVEHPNPIFRLVVQYMFWKTRKRQIALKGVLWSPDRLVDLSDPLQVERVTWDCINFGEQQGDELSRGEICEQLGTLLEISYEEVVRSRILHLMSPEQLHSLRDADVTINLHTHRHTFPADDQAAAEREITDNRAALQRMGVGAGRHFCYPSGQWEQRQSLWLDNLGVKSSTTCDPGQNSPETPRHALRRYLDSGNIHQLEFEASVSGFLDLVRGMLVRVGAR